MDILLVTSAAIVVFIGFAHSYLGERHVFPRLFALSDLPLLRHDRRYTENVIRFAWHLTSIAWWGLAAVIVSIAGPVVSRLTTGIIVGFTLMISGIVIVATAGTRHPAWWLFILAGGLALFAAR